MAENLVDSYEIFKKCVTTLSKTSLDNSDKKEKKYMTQSQQSAINFDKVKEKYSKEYFSCNNTPFKSVDALLQLADKTYLFIEFKNGKRLDGEERAKIREKLSNSLLLFADILNTTFRSFNANTLFILVYNEEANPYVKQGSPSLNKIAKAVSKKSECADIRFDFDKIKPFLVYDVKTLTATEFEDFLSRNRFIDYQ